MKRAYFPFLLLCALTLACGVVTGGITPTVPLETPSPAPSTDTPLPLPPQAAEPTPQLSPTSAPLLPESLYFPLLADGAFAIRPDVWVEQTLESMPLERKIGQLILSGVDGDRISPEICSFVQELAPGGLIFRHGNATDPESLRIFAGELQACAQSADLAPLLTALPHEGEYVNRFWSGVTTFPAALALGATGDPALAYQVAFAQGQELAHSGVNIVLGPVADVLLDFDNEVISQRTYGGDPALVGQFVAQAVDGYRRGGVIPALKHFPGYGGVVEDPSLTLPVDEVSLADLRTNYLPAFQEGLAAGAPAVMLAHAAYPTVDGSLLPASQSITMVQYLRQEMGFQGVILSDALRMKAATGASGSVPAAALRSIQAGVDLLLIDRPEDAQAARDYLLAAVQEGSLNTARVDEAVRRILTLKAAWGLMGFPLPEAPFPDWAANQELARAVGRRSVALLKDDAGLIPLPQSLRRVLLVVPGSDWDLYPALEAALIARGHEVEIVHYPPPWQGRVEADALLDDLPARAPDFDLVLVFTWQAHLNRLGFGDLWQAALVPRLVKAEAPLVVVAVKSPTDLLEFPQVGTYLTMFGSTPGQEAALIDALTGQAAPQGVNPLPALLP